MGGHYEKGLFRQLQEVMERCDRLENKLEETRVEERKKPLYKSIPLRKRIG